MAINGGTVRWTVEADTSSLESSMKKVDALVAAMSASMGKDAFKGLTDSAEESAKKVDSAFSKAMASVSQSMGSLSNALTPLDSALTGLTSKLTAFASVQMGLGARSGFNLVEQLESSQTGLSFLLKDQKKAADLMARIRKEAQRTPFDVGNLSQYTQQLTAVSKDGDKALDTVLAFGQGIVASGQDLSALGLVAMNLQQIGATGKVTQMDLMQFKRAVPIFEDVMNASGITSEKLKSMKDPLSAITKAFQKFGQENDVYGASANNIQQLKASFEEAFAGTFADAMQTSGAIDLIKKAIQQTSKALEDNKPLIEDVFRTATQLLADFDVGAFITGTATMLKTVLEIGREVGKVLRNVVTFVGGGDINKGIKTITQLLVGTTVLVKTLKIGSSAISGITGALSTFGKVSKVVKNPAEAVSGAVNGMVGNSAPLTKGQNIMKTMRSGILNIILLAGAIAAVGYALKLANDAIPDDIGGLVNKLFVITSITGAMSLFAAGISKLKIKPRDILTLAGTAAVIGAVGYSLKYAYDTIPADLGGLSAKMGVLIGFTTAVGLLSLAIAKFKISPRDILTLAGVAGVIAVAGLSLQVANNAITPDLGMLSAKLGVMALAVIGMGSLALIANKLGNSIRQGLLTILGISGTLALAALSLGFVNAVMPADLGLLLGKLGVMGLAIIGIGGLAIAGSKLGSSIIPGLLVIIAASGTIALAALSLGFANSVIPSDLGLLAGKLGVMALAIVGMSAIAGVASLFSVAILTGLVTVALVAGGIAVTALAIGYANTQIPADLKQFSKKMLTMGVVIGGMTALAAAVGAVVSTGVGAVLIGAGLATMLGITAGMAAIALGIATINKTVPADIGAVKGKVDILTQILNHMSQANLGNVINNLGQALNIQPLQALVSAYVGIAENLAKIGTIQIDPVPVAEKVKLIQQTVEYISKTDGDSPAGLMQTAVNNFISSINTAIIGQTVKIYGDIATTLNTIQNIELRPAEIKTKIELLQNIVEMVSTKGQDFMAGISGAINNWANASSVESAAKVIDIYSGLSDKLSAIAQMKIEEATIKNNISALNRVMEVVFSAKGNGGLLGAIGDFFSGGLDVGQVETAVNIIKKMKEIGDVAMKLPDVSGKHETVDNMKTLLQKIADLPSAGNIGEKEHMVNMATAITYKMSELGKAITLINIAQDSHDRIQKATDAVHKLFQINEGVGDMGFKEHILGMATSIAYKMGEFGRGVLAITIPEDAQNKIQNATNALHKIFQINEGVGDMGFKEHITGMGVSIAYKMAELSNALATIQPVENAQAIIGQVTNALLSLVSSMNVTLTGQGETLKITGGNLGNMLREGIMSKTGDITNAGLQLQGALWRAIESKMPDEYSQGSAMAGKFVEGLRTKSEAIAQAGRDMQGSLWNAINGKMNDQFHQGGAMAQRFADGLRNNLGSTRDSGVHAVNGFLGGANSVNVYSAGYNMAARFLQGVKKRGDEHSPWKTTQKSGIFAGQGLIKGVESIQTKVFDAAWNLTDGVVEIMENMNQDFSPTVSPQVTGTSPRSSFMDEDGASSNNRVIIKQTNNNYTQFSIDQLNRDLEWTLRKV